jgi:hypothetical protein
MSARDDLEKAAEQARTQVRAAREALASSRDARGGGRARDAKEAERQLLSLRAAVSADVRSLRDRLSGQDPAASRALRNAALGTSGTIAAVVGAGLVGRSAISRRADRRTVQRQAVALARALAAQDRSRSSDAPTGDSSGSGRSRRRGRGGVTLLAFAGAVAAAALFAQQRRSAPIDPDDLWLPEEPSGPA